MYGITLHNTDTEEIVGTVTEAFESSSRVDAHTLFSEVYLTWKKFNDKHSEGLGDLDDPIEDFVEFHNYNSRIRITSICLDYIQL